MIYLEHSLSGTTIGEKLIDNTEEMAYALQAISEHPKLFSLGKEIAEYLSPDDASDIAKALRTLADGIEA